MRRLLKRCSIEGTRKCGNLSPLSIGRHHFKDQASFNRFLGGARRYHALQRRFAEDRRAQLPHWTTLRRGDMAKLARKLRVYPQTILRDYRILKAREFNPVSDLAGLLKAIAAMPAEPGGGPKEGPSKP